jgi:hypothetical protein
MYAVIIKNNIQEEVSRYFNTLKAARKWAKWLAGKTYNGIPVEVIIRNDL